MSLYKLPLKLNARLIQNTPDTEIEYEELIALLPGSIYWKDKNGVYLGCNSAMAEMVGLADRYQVIGKTDYDLSWKEQVDKLIKHDRLVMDSGKPHVFEETGRLGNGEEITVITHKIPLRNKKNEIMVYLEPQLILQRLKKPRKISL